MQEDQVNRLTFEAVDKVLSERLNELEKQRENLQKQLNAAQEEIIEKNSRLSQLQTEMGEAHHLVDIEREKFENEITHERERNRTRIEELQGEVEKLQLLVNSHEEDRGNEESKMAKTIEELSKQIEIWRERAEVSESKLKEQATLDQELRKLRRENAELTAAYNDLNEDFENHKAEHGSVVTSNRDLTARIGLFIVHNSYFISFFNPFKIEITNLFCSNELSLQKFIKFCLIMSDKFHG
ncbi:unnamed protein product [Onchocerca flexuosa]|uniref:Myosin_tail_1 domain-containing protein n=1 Tax=Onchocerca flexuosa TaxID=387005 RepID=A0A183HG76_9BILA|nr:unnamed protein product [Onchocerca flexuosa]